MATTAITVGAEGFVPFAMERLLGHWENQVEYYLSESGVKPMTMRELVQDPQVVEQLIDTELNYPQANGLPELREEIAALYPGATPDNVLVTVGAIQANYATFLALTKPGNEVAVMLPNYMQLWGLAQNHGRAMRNFYLKEELGWGLDLDELEAAVTPNTRFVAIVNPNNPTGHILTRQEREAIVAVASRVGAWLLCDEVYSGAERTTDEFTPTFYGSYDKVVAVNSMSKAYGLPGLRIGWVVAPTKVIEKVWAWQDYVTIMSTLLGNKLTAIALSSQVRPRILTRTRDYVRRGFEHVQRFVDERLDLAVVPPQAAAISFVRYRERINSTKLMEKLIREKSTLACPGDLFGMDHFLRISFGLPAEHVKEGLRRLGEVLDDVE